MKNLVLMTVFNTI